MGEQDDPATVSPRRLMGRLPPDGCFRRRDIAGGANTPRGREAWIRSNYRALYIMFPLYFLIPSATTENPVIFPGADDEPLS